MVRSSEQDCQEDYKLMIAGGCDFVDYPLLKRTVDYLLVDKHPVGGIIIVSGASEGAEMLGEKYAAEMGFEVAEFLPDAWEHKKADNLRHQMMTEFADGCVCFWDGKSESIKRFIDATGAMEIVLTIVHY